jgi:hypothetical protein
LVVAIVLAVRQTRWRGASLSPVFQRRRVGQHLGAAIGLMRTHLGLFAPIGMLLPIAGLAAAGLQRILERYTEFGDGLALAGAGSVWGSVAALLIGMAIITPVTGVVYVAVAVAVRDLENGASPTGSRSLVGARDHPRGVVTELFTRALTNALMVTVVLFPLGLWLLARWAVVAAASLESPHPARRSVELTRGRRLRTGAFAALVTGLSIAIPALAATVLLLLTGWSFIFVNLVTGLFGAVVIPVAAAAMALLHGDLVAGQPDPSSVPIDGTPRRDGASPHSG